MMDGEKLCCSRRAAARRPHCTSQTVLLQAQLEAATTGRLSQPVRVEEVDLSSIRIAPRFAVAQPKEDGTMKVRPVDDCTVSGLYDATLPTEKLVPDTADRLFVLAR
jgi:hypothetical protein